MDSPGLSSPLEVDPEVIPVKATRQYRGASNARLLMVDSQRSTTTSSTSRAGWVGLVFRFNPDDLKSSRSDDSSLVSSSKAVYLGVSAIPIRRKLVSVAGVGFVSLMKIWISPIGMIVNRVGSSLAGT
jgi:hypothetical protein